MSIYNRIKSSVDWARAIPIRIYNRVKSSIDWARAIPIRIYNGVKSVAVAYRDIHFILINRMIENGPKPVSLYLRACLKVALYIFGIDPENDYTNLYNELQRGRFADIQKIKKHANFFSVKIQGGPYNRLLEVAIEYGAVHAVIEILIDKGRDLNEIDIYAYSILLYALKHKANDDVIRLILYKTREANLIPKLKVLALRTALEDNASSDVIWLLVDYGTDVKFEDSQGNTPLHIAFENNAHELAKLLLDKGADFNVQNNNGETPLDIAKRKYEQDETPNIEKGKILSIMLSSPQAPICALLLASAKTIERLGKKSAIEQLPIELLRKISQCFTDFLGANQKAIVNLYNNVIQRSQPTVAIKDKTEEEQTNTQKYVSDVPGPR